MKTTGVVKFWSMIVINDEVEVSRYHNWDTATEAFKEAVKLNPKSATVYAHSGKYGSRRIPTWEHKQ